VDLGRAESQMKISRKYPVGEYIEEISKLVILLWAWLQLNYLENSKRVGVENFVYYIYVTIA